MVPKDGLMDVHSNYKLKNICGEFFLNFVCMSRINHKK
jgi:hypothetical protein